MQVGSQMLHLHGLRHARAHLRGLHIISFSNSVGSRLRLRYVLVTYLFAAESLKMIGLLLASYRTDSISCSQDTCPFTAAYACTSSQPTRSSGPCVLESAWIAPTHPPPAKLRESVTAVTPRSCLSNTANRAIGSLSYMITKTFCFFLFPKQLC